MTQNWRHGLSAEATMFVAFMLLVQALFSGLSLGAEASSLDRDSSGVICSTDGGRLAGRARAGAPHEHHPDCCMFGCSMAGGAAASLAGANHIPPMRSIVVGRTVTPVGQPAARAELSPRKSRAPPALS